jgi:NAD(P)-dependent dehydrogenase (short-subunit alcohol dehydrogenase family)
MSAAPELPAGTYVVTGGGGAIGAAVVDLLAARGAESLLVVDLDGDAAAGVAARHGAASAALDVADPDAIDAFAAGVVEGGGRIAGLVHAAGIFAPSSFPDVGWEEWMKTLQVNLVGAYRLTEKLSGAIVDGGSIVNITSIEAFHVLSSSGSTSPHYAASKGGLEMMTRSLAADFGPRGIRVNAVAPGTIATPINEAVLADGERRSFIEDRVPLRFRLGTTDQIAGPVVFLLSRDADYVTGTTLVVDGGLTLGNIRRRDASV